MAKNVKKPGPRGKPSKGSLKLPKTSPADRAKYSPKAIAETRAAMREAGGTGGGG